MRLFSNYLVILVLLVLWPALLLLFLMFSAWLERFAAQPPRWVLRRQAAAQARAEALSAASEGPVTGRTRYWNPPRTARAGRGQAAQSFPNPAAQPPEAPPGSRWTAGPKPASAVAGRPAGVGGGRGSGRPPPARPGGAEGRGASVDENTEPMAGFPVDRLPPDPASGRNRRRPADRPADRPAPGIDPQLSVPVARDRPGR